MPETSEAPKRLLLIEDSDSDAELFEIILEEAAPGAYAVDRVDTLAAAISKLGTVSVDCAIVDLGLPDAEGIEIIESLAACDPLATLIVLTGREDEALGIAAIEAGASDYLPKRELEGASLTRTIRYALLRKRVENSLAEAQSIARLGSWELDLTTEAMTWSRELYRLFDFGLDVIPSHDQLLNRSHPLDRQASIDAVSSTIQGSGPYTMDHRIILDDGSTRWLRAHGRIEADASGQAQRLLGTAQDITEQKMAEAALTHQSLHDPLTGLPNRDLYLNETRDAIGRLKPASSPVAALYIDIDRFTVVNHSLGYEVGDRLINAVAERLRDGMRPGDILARLAGDEFAVLCPRVADAEEAQSIADRLRSRIAEPFQIDGARLVVSVSVGIALTASTSTRPDALLTDANAAMYQAKAEGRARSSLFSEVTRARAVDRLETEQSLRRSIADGDLRVVYQPIVRLLDGHVLGHEALVRWAHPVKGLLGPDQFITVAEDSGLIVALGEWVLRDACHQAKRFQEIGPAFAHLTMSVNLSGGQLGQPNLREVVASALSDAHLRPKDLQLEMTESVLMSDAMSAITVLSSLKALGVRLGVDDFGTGFSSLAYLRRFPVDVLKIDRSFVDGLGHDLEDSAIVAAIVSLADTLGLHTIAEGVETEMQRQTLLTLGTSRGQGYLFAGPLTADHATLELLSSEPAHLGVS